MKKFNWKGRRFIGGVLTVVFMALGIANPEIAAQAGSVLTCAVVECDA
ncbi:hypothetical protein [Cellvibrio sp. QJXJ]|nr:hypothetical protein [Cellvibrio sp. QJXJ]UUA73561.1 hypothetical protein NNX04_03720 [Cellvibrio sp. QJXJ]